MSGPKDAFELMVWERLYAASISACMDTEPALAKTLAAFSDAAFEEWRKRSDAMLDRDPKSKVPGDES